jgi:hypothetical protein
MLTIYSLGFVIHPYTVDAADSWACPFLAVPRVPHHQAYIVADGILFPIHGGGLHSVTLIGQNADGHILPPAPAVIKRQPLVDGLPPNPSSQASWENFELVPDVRTFMTQPQLDTAWRSQLLFEVACIGGEMTAVPDKWTLTRSWRWPDGHEQVVSALTRYSVGDFHRGELVIDNKSHIPLHEGSIIHLLNVVPTISDSDVDRYVRGLDHHVAVLALSKPQAHIELKNPLTSKPLALAQVTNSEYQTNVAPTLKAAKGPAGSGGTAAVTIEAGYPSCANRRIRLT